MRSILYLITGKPVKIDDWLDLCRRQVPREVVLDLTADDFVAEQTVVTELVARYLWRFPSREAACEEVCGRFSTFDDGRTKSRRIAQANKHLRRRLDRLGTLGIAVCNGAKRFEDR